MFEDAGWSELARPNPVGIGLAEEVEWEEEDDLEPATDSPEEESLVGDEEANDALGFRADGRSKGDDDEDEEVEDEEFDDDEDEFEEDEDLDEDFDEFDDDEELDDDVEDDVGEEEEDV
jgi:hypothetical protein